MDFVARNKVKNSERQSLRNAVPCICSWKCFFSCPQESMYFKKLHSAFNLVLSREVPYQGLLVNLRTVVDICMEKLFQYWDSAAAQEAVWQSLYNTVYKMEPKYFQPHGRHKQSVNYSLMHAVFICCVSSSINRGCLQKYSE